MVFCNYHCSVVISYKDISYKDIIERYQLSDIQKSLQKSNTGQFNISRQ